MAYGDIVVNDNVEIRKRQRFFHNGRVSKTVKQLPVYQAPGLSDSNHLAFTDCHKALETIIYEARLISFEIARKRLSRKDRLLRRSITLEGEQGNLDVVFSTTIEEIKSALSVPIIEKLDFTGEKRLKDVLGNLLKAHEDFKSSSGNHPSTLKKKVKIKKA